MFGYCIWKASKHALRLYQIWSTVLILIPNRSIEYCQRNMVYLLKLIVNPFYLINIVSILPLDKFATLLLCLPATKMTAKKALSEDSEYEMRSRAVQIISPVDIWKYISKFTVASSAELSFITFYHLNRDQQIYQQRHNHGNEGWLDAARRYEIRSEFKNPHQYRISERRSPIHQNESHKVNVNIYISLGIHWRSTEVG